MEVRTISATGAEVRPLTDLPALLARPDGLVWVDIPHCDDDAVRVLTEVFRFHPLAIQDCVERNRVPKMHAYAAWAAIFFAPTLIGTVYGMNFDHMPELHWHAGYPLSIAAMVIVPLVLYRVFKRRGWL